MLEGTVIDTDLLDKVISYRLIFKRFLLFHRKIGEIVHQSACVDANAFVLNDSFTPKLDSLHATARRSLLQDIAKYFTLPTPLHIRTADQCICNIQRTGLGTNTSDLVLNHDQMYRFSRYSQANLYFGTKGYESKVISENIHDGRIIFMSTIIPHLFSQQTTADTYGDLVILVWRDQKNASSISLFSGCPLKCALCISSQ